MTVPKRKSIHECGYGHGDMAGRSRISICKPGMAMLRWNQERTESGLEAMAMGADKPYGPVQVELVHKSHGGESSYYSYRCAMGGSILVEVEMGGFDTIREEPYDPRCERCCRLDGDWNGSLRVTQERPCWREPSAGTGRSPSYRHPSALSVRSDATAERSSRLRS